jgi:hypothetical protein
MKKSELNFKCVVPDEKVFERIEKLLGVEYGYSPYVACVNGKFWRTTFPDVFCNEHQVPMVTWEEAIDLINSVSVDDTKIFDIKPFDKILYKTDNGVWRINFFECLLPPSSFGLLDIECKSIIEYKNNERIHLSNIFTPSYCWVLFDGKPCWVKANSKSEEEDI